MEAMNCNSANDIITNNIVKKIPSSALYIRNFISEDEEKNVIHCVNKVPLPKWTQLSNRRLQNWGGIPHPKGMIAEEIPNWLLKYIERITKLNIFEVTKKPNHILINEYLPGQGIMPHSDGPLFHPIVSTISCGSHTVLDFYERLKTEDIDKSPEYKFSLLLEPRSLLILQGELYHNYLHSIEERTKDVIHPENIKNIDLCSRLDGDHNVLERSTRISLTIRHVPKVSGIKLKFGK